MIVIERMLQKIYPDKWPELDELDKKYTKVEKKLGFPPKKRFNCIAGSLDSNILVIEREWESFAVMEATFEKAFVDPDYQKLLATSQAVKSTRWEFYNPRP